jgi:hypothetical protein
MAADIAGEELKWDQFFKWIGCIIYGCYITH